jgi:putative two-component system response regulator
MNTHAAVGYELLSGTGDPTLELAATIAWTHHERFDGSGYPRHLRGEEIPLCGRIAAVADVFDALTSDRVYRAGMSWDHALEIIRTGRGTQYDPTVVDAFLGQLDAARAVYERYRPLAAGV